MFNGKVFCIGLHKTGTSSLHKFAEKCGFKALHSASWQSNQNVIDKYDFFSDGGSHFDGINEFDFRWLSEEYPCSKFILQTREPKSWVISKLKHAGWGMNTVIEKGGCIEYTNENWKKKRLENIEMFLRHKFNYENKVRDFFLNNCSDRFLMINITERDSHNKEVSRLQRFLQVENVDFNQLPHENKARSSESLPKEVVSFIDNKVYEIFYK